MIRICVSSGYAPPYLLALTVALHPIVSNLVSGLRSFPRISLDVSAADRHNVGDGLAMVNCAGAEI